MGWCNGVRSHGMTNKTILVGLGARVGVERGETGITPGSNASS